MRILRLKLAELFGIEGLPVSKDLAAISAFVLKRYGFLPQPIIVHVEEEEVVIQYPEESANSQTEAARLAEKAGKRAAEGNYQKAIAILNRVLELQPSLHAARRDLAMAYVEIGDIENATNHLIEVLRLNPRDAWSWVVLANLYIQHKSDPETGEKFLRKALEISPNDAWALNSLAAVIQSRGKSQEAIPIFERAIAANPEFANAYYGKAVAYHDLNQTEKTLSTLADLFSRAKMQDIRSRPVYERARILFAALQTDLAEKNQSDCFKLVQNYKAELETVSDYPIRITQEEFESKIGATIQMAWKHKRDFHLLKVRASFPPQLITHLECHELTHLKLECEARKFGKNLFFSTSARSREAAIRSIAGDIRRLEKQGYSEKSITDITMTMVRGTCEFLFNCPLDMIIERHLHTAFPVLNPSQFLSVRLMALEAEQANRNSEIRKLTPKKIMQSSLALNGAYALFLDDLFGGASDFVTAYRNEEAFGLSQRLWKHWQQRSLNLQAGGEYSLVDEFADMLGLRDWYEWQPDAGRHDVTAEPLKEGTTNPSLLKAKHPAAVFYFLDALKRFDGMSPEQIRNVTIEIAVKGQTGLDYASPDEKYELRTIQNRKFSGLHLMCLMFAGFKRVAPEHDAGMDLEEPFLTALELHQAGEGENGP